MILEFDTHVSFMRPERFICLASKASLAHRAVKSSWKYTGRGYFVLSRSFNDFFYLFIHHNRFGAPAKKLSDDSFWLDVFTLGLGCGRGRLLVWGTSAFRQSVGYLYLLQLDWRLDLKVFIKECEELVLQCSWACLTEALDPHGTPVRPLFHFVHLVLQGIDGRFLVGYNVIPLLELLLEYLDSPGSYGVTNFIATRP